MTWLKSEQEAALNDVVRALREAADREEAAAERSEDAELRSLLRDAAARREAFATRLVRQSEAEAAVPDPDAEFLREIASTVKAALADDADRVIADDILEGETALEGAVQEALSHDPPDTVRQILESVEADVRSLRRALEPGKS
jgi:uncharacterized protein (TIGR02284 family)